METKQDVELHPRDDSEDDYEVVDDDEEPQFEDTPEKELDIEDGNDKKEDEDRDDDDDDDDVAVPPVEGSYDPSDFDNLDVDGEVRDLFGFIMKYTPQTVELDHKFKPFIPDYIPAVGDIDAFIRCTRPDDKHETLGLTVLDEPSAQQSDPNVLELQLRVVSKQASSKARRIKRI